jgi:hypothetical protein
VLQRALEDVPMPVRSSALTPNHWHLLLWPEPKAIPQGKDAKRPTTLSCLPISNTSRFLPADESSIRPSMALQSE